MRAAAEGRWNAVEGLLHGVERPARYIDSEWGAIVDPDADYRAVLVYPDTYEIGQANQALTILYEILNSLSGVAAERAYVPWLDMADAMRVGHVPLLSLESSIPVRDVDLIGITLPHELAYSNVLELLDLAGVPLRAADRDENAPLVVGGGPCAYNPEPLAPFFDAVLLGEGEEAVIELVHAHRSALDAGLLRSELLAELARIKGVYVPELYAPSESDEPGASMLPTGTAPALIVKRVLEDLSAHRAPVCPIVPFVDVVHDRFTLEVLRGCTRGCRFCQAGMIYRPVRERSADDIVRDTLAGLSCTGYDEVSLTSLSTTDHSALEEVLRRLDRRLEGTGVSVSLPSLRVDAFSVEMARLISRGKKSGLTFAPEAGTQRLRDVINKNISEAELIETVRQAFLVGWRRLKLYFMIGLPTETDEDVRGIGALVRRVLDTARESVAPKDRGSIRVAVSVSTFVPKPHTPFQWDAQLSIAEVQQRQAVLRDAMPRKGVELSWHDPEVSFLEGVMARGGREIADVVEAAWRGGARFDAWTERFDLPRWLEAFSSAGVDPTSIANRERGPEERFPWEHLSCGVSRTYLAKERQRALEGRTTPDCSFDGCTGCDACDELGVSIRLAGERGRR